MLLTLRNSFNTMRRAFVPNSYTTADVPTYQVVSKRFDILIAFTGLDAQNKYFF